MMRLFFRFLFLYAIYGEIEKQAFKTRFPECVITVGGLEWWLSWVGTLKNVERGRWACFCKVRPLLRCRAGRENPVHAAMKAFSGFPRHLTFSLD